MGFVHVNISEEVEKERKSSPEFNKAWTESREEYRLIGEMISIRKQNKMTQSKLAEITGNKQQVISRIEKKESNPSLKMFCNILNALGYELKIVKKGINCDKKQDTYLSDAIYCVKCVSNHVCIWLWNHFLWL